MTAMPPAITAMAVRSAPGSILEVDIERRP
jgi:hypothetical protein